MQTPLNTLDTKQSIDYENLNIITRPRPPRRRQSGVSLVPFRPYVKCLTSVRQPFSFANGYDQWMVMGRDEKFFTQPNARCIGSLLEDCGVSDTIRWDIEAESTRLPMMCKLWMIVDGAVIERGKPHLVQDAAVQVFTSGCNLRTLLATQNRNNPTSIKTTSDRRRRQSWHDVNEYHSVPYYQYTCTVQIGFQRNIQCNMDTEYSTSLQAVLSEIEEEMVDLNSIKDIKKDIVRETVHHSLVPQNRVHISIMTQTESHPINRSTTIDSQFITMFNLNLETNEILLSSIVNPYRRAVTSNDFSEIISIYRHNVEYKHRGISTGDDYPHAWVRLTTDFILSDFSKNQNMEKEKEKVLPTPSPRQNRSVQTDTSESKILSSSTSRSLRIQNSSSSVITTNHYESIDETNDRNNAQRSLPFVDLHQRIDPLDNINYRFNSCCIEKSSTRDYANVNANKQSTSSKQSENEYNIFVSSLHHQEQQSYSTPESQSNISGYHSFSNDTTRTRTKSSESTSTILLASLLERYERTLRERKRAVAIINDELLDIDDVLKRYRPKIKNSPSKQSSIAMELYRDISFLSAKSKQDQPPPPPPPPSSSSSSSTTTTTTTTTTTRQATIVNIIKDKYRSMPGLTSEDMIKAYMPIPKVHVTNSSIISSKKRQSRFEVPLTMSTRPDYCDLCLTGYNTSSAWIRYNERRIEELQKRIDLMLTIDDNEETKLLLSSSHILPTTATVTQRIDDILWNRSTLRSRRLFYDDYRFLSPRRYQNRLPHRLHQSLPNSSRLLSRNIISRSITPVSKSVRISTQSVSPHTARRRARSASRPIVSILRPRSVPATPESNKLIEPYVRKSEIYGNMYDLKQCSIPRYYRLYNDVSFRQIFNFSRILDTYLDSSRESTKGYSSFIRNFALEPQLPSPVTSVA